MRRAAFDMRVVYSLRALGVLDLSPAMTLWLVLLLATSSTAARAKENLPLQKWLEAATRSRKYKPMSAGQLQSIVELFRHTIHLTDIDQAVADQWTAQGWRLRRFDWNDEVLLVLDAAPGQEHGYGFYVIRPHQLPGLVLQMPHGDSDEHTRVIGLRMFLEGSFGAAAWNTVHRNTVDVAHESHHPYSAFTRAMALEFPASYFAQIHGFSQGKRNSGAGREADLIISNGDEAPKRSTRRLAVTMQSQFPYGQVRLFPTEVGELGATTNVQAELLREMGNQRFVHLEMSESLRRRLSADPRARQAFLKNLAGLVD